MRITFDTNIFVNALIDEGYKTSVDNFINRQNSFLPISLNNEVRNIVLKVHTILVKISLKYNEKFQECFNEPDLIELKEDFDNLYKFLENLKDDPDVKNKVELMADITTSILVEMNKVGLHPPADDEVAPILQRMESKMDLLGQKIPNKQDIKHLLLSEAFAEIFADDETYFITDDYVDIINNKEDIENILNYVKVFDFKSSPISLV